MDKDLLTAYLQLGLRPVEVSKLINEGATSNTDIIATLMPEPPPCGPISIKPPPKAAVALFPWGQSFAGTISPRSNDEHKRFRR